MQAVFVHWGNENEFPTALAAPLKSAGKTLVIFWEAMDYNVSSPTQAKFNYDSVLSGTWDSYIKSFAASVKTYGGPVIVIPFEEANGNWYPWSGAINGNTPAKHVSAYRHVRDLFAGVANAKFGWTMNNVSVPNTSANKIENYYPGDAYVDYVGVNGFNFANPWQSFKEVFDAPLKVMATYNKPIYIFSTASADGTQKASWITQGLGTDIKNYPLVKGWVWFHENKERDWRINSDSATLAAFKSVLP
jgi:beta-mannanase